MPRFARRAFTLAGWYGIAVMLPQYFMADRIARDTPPAITHLEYFYGFIGIVLAWQVVFLLIGRDPVRYRALMPVAVLEKLGFAVPALLLYAQGRLPGAVLGFALIDVMLAGLFLMAYRKTTAAADPADSRLENRAGPLAAASR